MITLHLDISTPDGAVFWGESPVGEDGEFASITTGRLIKVLDKVLWDSSRTDAIGEGRAVTSIRNLLMFLSDVKGRVFSSGIFLATDVLVAAKIFRRAAKVVESGKYLPAIIQGGEDEFHAVWSAVEKQKEPFFYLVLDSLVRLAGRTPMEAQMPKYETLHDAWLGALRGEDSLIKWPNKEDIKNFQCDLQVWQQPLVMSPSERAALTFSLVPPKGVDGAWKIKLGAAPETQIGLISLGQAVRVFPPLRSLSKGTAEITKAEAEKFIRVGAQALIASGYSVKLPANIPGEHITAKAQLTPETCEEAKGKKTPAEEKSAALGKIRTKLTIHVDGKKVDEEEIRFLLDQNSPLVFFRDHWIEVDRSILKEALRALRQVKEKKFSMREAVSFSLGYQRIGGLRVSDVKAHGWLRGLINELKGDARFKLIEQPKEFNGTLRDYQLRGASWLAFLSKWGFGPCLADDMGLGKTIQTIAYLLNRNDWRYPALVVSPVTVTTNWQREFAKFAPSLKVYLHQGAGRSMGADFDIACRKADVVITGYSLMVKDFRQFAQVPFSVLVLDEAQTIKNPDTQVARAASALNVPVKIALTGTPLENSVADLWALENFLNPGLLGERREFIDLFANPIRENVHSKVSSKLKHILEPFMLRRLKSEPGIAAELGKKREIREYCTLSALQRGMYENALDSFRNDVHVQDDGSMGINKGRILALLTELKEICDAPELLTLTDAAKKEGEEVAVKVTGGKIERLDALLESIFETGESALIFTQYARMGRLLRSHLQEVFGRRFPFLYGGLSPQRREEEIRSFNEDAEPNAFILSLKAGGFGLNLTRATHVIHFDRWWNPAVENQATDRAHRIGQSKTVFVHTFICAGTLEDHIDEMLESKRYLANELVSSGEGFLLRMNAREFENIVKLEGDIE